MPSTAQKIIKDRQIIDNVWSTVNADNFSIPDSASHLAVNLATWQVHKTELLARKGLQLGITLLGEDEPQAFADDIALFSLVCIEFPVFSDGRGYSLARMLRERYQYTGELRATGDVLRDQLFFLSRVGFNAFEIRSDRSTEDALASLKDFSVSYQAANDQPKPIYGR